MRGYALALLGLLLLGAALPARAQGGRSAASAGEPVCTYIPPLRYPPAIAAHRPHLTGSVLVRVEIDGQGRLTSSELVRSELPELFIVEALRAARQGRFAPAPGQGRDERRSLVLLLRFTAEPAAASDEPGDADTAAPTTPSAAPSAVPPAAPPDPRPTAPASAAPLPAKGSLRVVAAGFGRGVENRQLVDRGEVFAEGDRVFFWMEVDGARVGQVLRHIWIFRGREMQEIALTLKAERWITWSYKTFFADQRGTWLLELRDEDDDLIGSWSCYCE